MKMRRASALTAMSSAWRTALFSAKAEIDDCLMEDQFGSRKSQMQQQVKITDRRKGPLIP